MFTWPVRRFCCNCNPLAPLPHSRYHLKAIVRRGSEKKSRLRPYLSRESTVARRPLTRRHCSRPKMARSPFPQSLAVRGKLSWRQAAIFETHLGLLILRRVCSFMVAIRGCQTPWLTHTIYGRTLNTSKLCILGKTERLCQTTSGHFWLTQKRPDSGSVLLLWKLSYTMYWTKSSLESNTM